VICKIHASFLQTSDALDHTFVFGDIGLRRTSVHQETR